MEAAPWKMRVVEVAVEEGTVEDGIKHFRPVILRQSVPTLAQSPTDLGQQMDSLPWAAGLLMRE